jgi:hypothetical protein
MLSCYTSLIPQITIGRIDYLLSCLLKVCVWPSFIRGQVLIKTLRSFRGKGYFTGTPRPPRQCAWNICASTTRLLESGRVMRISFRVSCLFLMISHLGIVIAYISHQARRPRFSWPFLRFIYDRCLRLRLALQHRPLLPLLCCSQPLDWLAGILRG